MNTPQSPPPLPSPAALSFARASYLPRVLGLALGFLSLASVLAVQVTPWWVWLAVGLHGFVWPHLAWQLARRAPDPAAAERRNMLIDHAAGGFWIAAIAFNTLPAVLMLSMMGLNSCVGGGWRQLYRGLGVHAAGTLAGMLVLGLQWRPESSMPQVLASLPLLLLHPICMGGLTWRALDKLRKQREKLSYLSQHDGLSGLYNRVSWEALVKLEFDRVRRTGEPATLALVDFDHFKRINDTYGHPVGDELIRRFGERLRESLRQIDVPGRLGGEEFGVLLPHTALPGAEGVMQRLRVSLDTRPLLAQAPASISVGLAPLTPELRSHEAWIRLADQMLYRAKDQGRDCVVSAGQELAMPAVGQRTDPAAPLPAPIERQLFRGLQEVQMAAALFDPSDQLAWANEVFRQHYQVPASGGSFGTLMRRCHELQRGPRMDTDDVDAWLRAADAKRRSQPRRRFKVDMHGGQVYSAEEVSFENGWLFLVLWPEPQER